MQPLRDYTCTDSSHQYNSWGWHRDFLFQKLQSQIPCLSFPSTAGCNKGPKTGQALSSYIAQHEFLPTPQGRGCPAIPRSQIDRDDGMQINTAHGTNPTCSKPREQIRSSRGKTRHGFLPNILKYKYTVSYFYQNLSIAENTAGRNSSYLATRNKLSCYKLPAMQTLPSSPAKPRVFPSRHTPSRRAMGIADGREAEQKSLPWQLIHAQKNYVQQHYSPLLSGSPMKQKILRAVNLQ